MKRMVAGPHAVLEAVRAKPASVVVVYLEDGARRTLRELADEVGSRGVKIEERTKAELDALAERHQGVVAITGEYRYAEIETLLGGERGLVVALDEITDPHNLGAIVRSAVAYGAIGIVTLKDRAAPVTPVVVRASAGATEHARIVRVTNLARTLAELRDVHGMQIVGLAADGDVEIDALPETEGARVLVIGSEGKGIRRLVREQCDVIARIPIVGPVASLNASVAAGIALHCASRDAASRDSASREMLR
jgi:23S rRNA (guanosine2251-2'-O)-methyltransferase